MEHVDVDKMNTDLQYRFDYVSKFLKFTKNDIQLLNTVGEKLVPLIPTAVDGIYDTLFSFDVTKTVFAKNKVNFQGATTDPADSLNLTPERIAALKESLSKYLKKVLTQAEWDDAFLGYLSHLGKVHANKADSKNINVSYIHMNATLGLAEHILIDALLNHDLGLDEKTKNDAVLAVNKFFWLQNDLFTMHYVPT